MTDDMPSEAPADVPTTRMLSWARNSALYRLERKMMTEKELFDAVAKKARQKFEDISTAQVKALAESAVAFGYSIKALDDANYAGVKTRSAVRSGKSKRAIAQKLAQKGVAAQIVEGALEESNDLVAAVNFARKRRFGPYRREEADERQKTREFSAFARNGFSFEIGKKIFAMTLEEAEDLLYAELR